MQEINRKAVVAAYKKRKVEAGIFRVRCSASDETWVGKAPDLESVRNRLWFTLKLGTCTDRALQQAWNRHGPDGFEFDILDRLAEDEPAYSRNRVLQERLLQWAHEIGAHRI